MVHDARPGGGQDRYVLALANHLSRRHDVTLFARTAKGLASTVTFCPIDVPGRPLMLLARTFARRAQAAVSQEDWDIIHAVGGAMPGANVVTAQYCHAAWRRAARRWPSEVIGPVERMYRGAETRFATRDERHAARHPSIRGLIGVSRRTLDDWRVAYGATAPIQAVVPNGVDLERFKPGPTDARRTLRASLGLPESSRLALLVGALVRKGVETAIWAVAALPDGVHLVAVGAGHHAAVASFAARAKLSDRVHIIAPVADIERFYAGADLMLLPSRYEPFGMVVAEAWASGLPTVASGEVGAIEWATPDEEVLVVRDPADARGFASAAQRILEHAPLANQLRERGIELARQLTWERVVRDTERVYERVIAG